MTVGKIEFGPATSKSEYKRLTTLRGEPNLLAENATLKAENARLRAALKSVEFTGTSYDRLVDHAERSCPSCCAFEYRGHLHGCEIGEALK